MLPRRSILTARTTLAACAGLAALMAILPTRLTWWTRDLAQPLQVAALPVSWLVKQVVLAARPAQPSDTATPTVARLRRDLAELTMRNHRLAEENDSLAQQVRELQRGIELNRDQDVPRLIAPVFASEAAGGSTLLMVRTAGLRGPGGEPAAISVGSVAVHNGVNLVGRVISVRGVVADIRSISDPAGGVLRAAIYPLEADAAADQSSVALTTQLSPVAGPGAAGRLRGPVFVLRLPDGQHEPVVAPGMLVRLTDPAWPRAAQLMVVGVVESVEISDNGRPIVTVRPSFDAQRLEEVTILVTGLVTGEPAPTSTPRGGRR